MTGICRGLLRSSILPFLFLNQLPSAQDEGQIHRACVGDKLPFNTVLIEEAQLFVLVYIWAQYFLFLP